MKTIYSLLFLSLILSSFGCGEAVEDEKTKTQLGEVSDAPLTAKISTINWEFRSGVAKPSLLDPSKYSVNLYESVPSGNICDYLPLAYENAILFTVSNKIGVYELGSNTGNSLTFYDAASKINLISTNGIISLSSINNQNVVGKLKAEYDTNTYADGRFLATICP